MAKEHIREVDGVRFIRDMHDVWRANDRVAVREHNMSDGVRYTIIECIHAVPLDSLTVFHSFVFAARRAIQESKKT